MQVSRKGRKPQNLGDKKYKDILHALTLYRDKQITSKQMGELLDIPESGTSIHIRVASWIINGFLNGKYNITLKK